MEKTSEIHGSSSGDIDGDNLGKDEQDPPAIGAIENKSFIGEAFSSWKTWRGIDDDENLRNADDDDRHSDQGEKTLGKESEETHRMDAIGERNFVAEPFTTYIRPEFSSKSWEMENAQPLMSSGQSRTHTLPRTRSLPEIRIPDDYETIAVDDKLETNSLQDNVITFLSADQLHSAPLKGIDDKDLHGSGVARNDVGNFMAGYDGGANEQIVKDVTRNSLSSNDTSYSFTVHEGDMGQPISQEAAAHIVRTTQSGKRKSNDTCKKLSKARRKNAKNQKAADLLPNLPETSNFVGDTTMILDQPISQIGGLYTVQISPANPEIQAVIQPRQVAAFDQAMEFSEKLQLENANQHWFTSKDDKSTLHDKGIKWKMGMWAKEEVAMLKDNIEKYCKMQNIDDPCQLIFGTPKDERKQFYKSIAKGISRPLFAIYRKTLRLYDSKNYIGKYSEEEVDKLKELHAKHGNDWTTIGNLIGRSAASVKDRCRLLRKNKKTGKWTEEEENFLTQCVRQQTNTKDGEPVTSGVMWSRIAEKLGTRTEKQCRSKWLNYLNWKEVSGKEWTKNDEIALIERISRLDVNGEGEIDWVKLAEQWPSARSHQWLRGKWWALKRRVPDFKTLDFQAILDYLQTTYLDSLKVKIDRQAVALASTFSVASNPVSLHSNERFTNHVTLAGLAASSSQAVIQDGDTVTNTQPLITTSAIDLASLQGYQLQLQLASLPPHQLLIPVSSNGLTSNITDHFIIPVNMTPAIITSSADQTTAQTGFIVQNVTTATDNPSIADNERGVELAQALVQTDLSIPVPAGELSRESLVSANIQAINAGMVVTLGESPLENSASEVEDASANQSYNASIDVLGSDDSAVKVVKVDQIENQDLGHYSDYHMWSHQQEMPHEAKSREEILKSTSSIAEETGFVEGETEWLENDLSYLIQSPLAVQLRTILGSESAESFLHPTIKDQKKVKCNTRFTIPKKQGQLNAHELWNNLRASSKIKLENSITNNYQRQNQQRSLENKLLRGIQFSRHRADLMHRVSQMNRNKTKDMMKDFFLPAFDDDFSDLIHENNNVNSQLIQVPKSYDFIQPIEVEKISRIHVDKADSKMRFISEEDCRCAGQFRERLEDLGVTIKTGISMVDKGYQSNSQHSMKGGTSDINATKKASKSAEDEANDLYNRLSNILLERQKSEGFISEQKCSKVDGEGKSWEPLTMEALIQQGNRTVEVLNLKKWYLG